VIHEGLKELEKAGFKLASHRILLEKQHEEVDVI
jgi:hypothetical protein